MVMELRQGDSKLEQFLMLAGFFKLTIWRQKVRETVPVLRGKQRKNYSICIGAYEL
jgi:hypothetical protein